MMTDDERFALVEKMRASQKRFFRARDNLSECKDLEAAVDRMLAQRSAGPGLFDDETKEPS